MQHCTFTLHKFNLMLGKKGKGRCQGQREGMRSGMGGRLNFPKIAAMTSSSPCSLLQCDLPHEKTISPPSWIHVGLWPLWPVKFSRQDTVTVPPTASAGLEGSAFTPGNVHYRWNQMPHKKPCYLGTTIPKGSSIQSCEEAVWRDCSSHPRHGNQNTILHVQLSRAFRWPQPQQPLLVIAWETLGDKGPAQPRQPMELWNMIAKYFKALGSRVTY